MGQSQKRVCRGVQFLFPEMPNRILRCSQQLCCIMNGYQRYYTHAHRQKIVQKAWLHAFWVWSVRWGNSLATLPPKEWLRAVVGWNSNRSNLEMKIKLISTLQAFRLSPRCSYSSCEVLKISVDYTCNLSFGTGFPSRVSGSRYPRRILDVVNLEHRTDTLSRKLDERLPTDAAQRPRRALSTLNCMNNIWTLFL